VVGAAGGGGGGPKAGPCTDPAKIEGVEGLVGPEEAKLAALLEPLPLVPFPAEGLGTELEVLAIVAEEWPPPEPALAEVEAPRPGAGVAAAVLLDDVPRRVPTPAGPAPTALELVPLLVVAPEVDVDAFPNFELLGPLFFSARV